MIGIDSSAVSTLSTTLNDNYYNKTCVTNLINPISNSITNLSNIFSKITAVSGLNSIYATITGVSSLTSIYQTLTGVNTLLSPINPTLNIYGTYISTLSNNLTVNYFDMKAVNSLLDSRANNTNLIGTNLSNN